MKNNNYSSIFTAAATAAAAAFLHIFFFFFCLDCRSQVYPIDEQFVRGVLGSSNSPLCALAQHKFVAVCGRTRKGCCLIPMLAMHPCIHSSTLSPPGLWTVKDFSCFSGSSARKMRAVEH